MKLPNADKAIIPAEKLRDYILSPSHPVGKFKAVFFESLGYTQENWQNFEEEIRNLIANNEASAVEQNEYGQKFEVKGIINGYRNNSSLIKTVWIILNDEENPRFITAYPED